MYARFPRKMRLREMVLDMAREFAVQFVDMQFTDIYGTLKADDSCAQVGRCH